MSPSPWPPQHQNLRLLPRSTDLSTFTKSWRELISLLVFSLSMPWMPSGPLRNQDATLGGLDKLEQLIQFRYEFCFL